MGRGRPRKTAEELKLSGTFGQHSSRQTWNTNNEKPLTAKLAPANYLRRTQIAWSKFMEMKAAQGVLSIEDEILVVRMFDALDLYFRLFDIIHARFRKGEIEEIYSDPEKRKEHRDLERSMHTAGEMYDKLAYHFGISPIERSKLVVAPQKTETEFMKLLERAKA